MLCCDAFRSLPLAAHAFVRSSVVLGVLGVELVEAVLSGSALGQESTAPSQHQPRRTSDT